MSFLRELAESVDIEGFDWKSVILTFSISRYVFENALTFRQYGVLKRKELPISLKGSIDNETFQKSQAYGRAKARYGVFSDTYSLIKDIATIYFDIFPLCWSYSGLLLQTVVPYLPKFVPLTTDGEISKSIAFTIILQVESIILSLPIDIYYTFVLEEKFGFNKQTPKLYINDTIKSFLISLVLIPPILGGFLKTILYFGDNFFFFLWLFMLIFQLVSVVLYPTLIQPLFNKLTPLEPGALKSSIEKLATDNKFPLSKLYVIDGSKRSSHSNAYFYGLPWTRKQIVIFDTLIEKSTVGEVTAVLGHELGHWALSHTTQTLIITQIHLFTIFALFSMFVSNKSLFNSFGFFHETPVLIGFMLFNDILQPVESLISFFMHLLSRKHEFEADEYAVKLGYANNLSSALIKLQIENLSSMDADWLYSSYHYSHPILSERLNAMGYKPEKKE